MKPLEELITMEEMVQTLKEKSINSNCRITGFEVYKDTYTENDVCISWWEYRGRQKPVDVVITCSSQEEQEQVYANWWLAIEKAGGKTRKAYEKEQEAIAKRHREWKAMKENKELDGGLRALGI